MLLLPHERSSLAAGLGVAVHVQLQPRRNQKYHDKLTPEEVREIRALHAIKAGTQKEIADAFNISRPAVHHIIHRRNYKWVE